MNWTEALEIVVARTRHSRYRELCASTNATQADAYRKLMIRLAAGEPPAAVQVHWPETAPHSPCCE